MKSVIRYPMKGALAFKIFFAFAALLFIAKPFFGFELSHRNFNSHIPHNILAKSFSKRKPESLQDADKSAGQIHRQLSNPLLVLISAISILLISFLSDIFEHQRKITGRTPAEIRLSLLPPPHPYLLSGKLIIWYFLKSMHELRQQFLHVCSPTFWINSINDLKMLNINKRLCLVLLLLVSIAARAQQPVSLKQLLAQVDKSAPQFNNRFFGHSYPTGTGGRSTQ